MVPDTVTILKLSPLLFCHTCAERKTKQPEGLFRRILDPNETSPNLRIIMDTATRRASGRETDGGIMTVYADPVLIFSILQIEGPVLILPLAAAGDYHSRPMLRHGLLHPFHRRWFDLALIVVMI